MYIVIIFIFRSRLAPRAGEAHHREVVERLRASGVLRQRLHVYYIILYYIILYYIILYHIISYHIIL